MGTDAANAVVHFKLPLRAGATNPSNQMYRLHFQGHSYQAVGKRIIDFILVGYAHLSGLAGAEHYGTHVGDVTQYEGSDGYVYVRVQFSNAYHLSVAIDSMAVGNGKALAHNSITAHFDNAVTL